MAEIGFYHLTRTDVAAALPALLGRTLAAGEKAVVRCADAARVKALDDALWLAEWLPHGTAASPRPDLQPVFLTDSGENPAQARFLFVVDGVGAADLAGFTRVFDLFDGLDAAAVAAARGRWAAAKAAGHGLAYWRQGEAGWEKAG